MEYPERVDTDTQARWERLADGIAAELRCAGLPVHRLLNGSSTNDGAIVGALVDVDPFADSGGVFVGWKIPSETFEPIGEAILSGQSEDPAVAKYGSIIDAMNKAMMTVLTAAGFTVEETPDDGLNPGELHILE